MTNSNFFDELIVSYLSNELNLEEEKFILDWINSDEQNKLYFEKLKSTWQLIVAKQATQQIDVDTEWRRFKEAIDQKHSKSFTDTNTSEPEKLPEAEQNNRPKVFRLFAYTAAAAAVLFVVALGLKLALTGSPVEKTVPTAVNKKAATTVPQLRVITNTTGKTRKVVLPDGSEVELFANSNIRFNEPFDANKRDITLVGKAYFKVAKDKTRPFTVFSDDITTTALGTQFTVTSFANETTIVVRLFEGKVVIKSAAAAKRRLEKDYYQLPGRELEYDKKKAIAVTRTFKNSPAEKNHNQVSVTEHPSIPKLGKESWFMFNNQPLSQVFDQLESMYKVRINYSKKDVSKIYFIGNFKVSDSLDKILKQIADINNFKVTKEDSVITITK